MITDSKKFDGRFVVDDGTVIMDRKAADNEYFHPDFHSSMNMGIHYLGEHYGLSAVEGYLTRYANNVYGNLLDRIDSEGFSAIEDKILDTYKKEKSPDTVNILREGDKMTVSISYCPAVKHLKSTGRKVLPWYRYTTETVMKVLAEKAGAYFEMTAYDEDTGAAEYRFVKNG